MEPSVSSLLVGRMFVLDDCPRIKCPFSYDGRSCEGVPHMSATALGRNIPPGSSSGPGLVIQFACEWGHKWELRFTDHSGSTWLGIA